MPNLNATERESVIRKVQKMLALGKDKAAFAEESNTALTLAAKWLDEHGLSMKDVEFDENDRLKSDQLSAHVPEKSYMLWPWEKDLAGSVVQRLIPVVLIWVCVGNGYRKFKWCGTKSDVEMAHLLWETLRSELKSLASNEETPLAKRSFLTGCVLSMSKRAYEIDENRKQPKTKTQSTALVVIKRDQIQKWVEKENPFLSPAQDRGSNLDRNAFYRGQEAGKSVRLTKDKELR